MLLLLLVLAAKWDSNTFLSSAELNYTLIWTSNEGERLKERKLKTLFYLERKRIICYPAFSFPKPSKAERFKPREKTWGSQKEGKSPRVVSQTDVRKDGTFLHVAPTNQHTCSSERGPFFFYFIELREVCTCVCIRQQLLWLEKRGPLHFLPLSPHILSVCLFFPLSQMGFEHWVRSI